jgi:hypothetical protein
VLFLPDSSDFAEDSVGVYEEFVPFVWAGLLWCFWVSYEFACKEPFGVLVQVRWDFLDDFLSGFSDVVVEVAQEWCVAVSCGVYGVAWAHSFAAWGVFPLVFGVQVV